MAAKNEQTYTLNGSMEHLFNIIKDPQFSAMQKFMLINENRTFNNVTFLFHHGVSFTSWGEKITITLVPLSPATTSVTVRSECTMPTQIIDMGKNKKVVKGIFEYLNRNLNPYSSPQSFGTVPNTPGVTYCKNCRNQIPNGSAFCSFCGAKQ